MKYTTAKKYIIGYKTSVAKRGGILNRDKLHEGLKLFEIALAHNKLLGKY
jgi:hypothetical protein